MATAPLQPLLPTAASQPLTAAYSLRKVNPAYAGNCLRVLDSNFTQRLIGFNVDGSLNTSALSGYGNGTTFTVEVWYDQSGNGHNAIGNTNNLPSLKFEGPGYANPYVDFTQRYNACSTSTTPLNLGGTRNLSAFAVFNTRGWSSNGTHARDPASHTSVYGPVIGFGTSYGHSIIDGATGAAAETAIYNREAQLTIDASTDFSATRWRNVWGNQQGALTSGGGDTRKFFSGRAHALSERTNSKIIIGNHGGLGNSHNGGIREVLIYNNAGALSDTECQRIALWQRQYWTGLANNRCPDRYVAVFSGQSNAEYYGRDANSGNGTANSNALTRVFAPALRTSLSIPAIDERELAALCTTTAFGGSSVVKRAQGTSGYWWDQDTGTDGTKLTSWKTGVNAITGKQYRKFVIMWSQGEQESTFLAANPGDATLVADWKAQTKLVWAAMRAHIGYDCPIVIQPLGLRTGSDAQMTTLRAVQAELAAEVAGVTLGTATTDLERQDIVHFSSSLQGPNQSANGYDLGATRLAAVIGPIMNGMAKR